MRNQGKFDIDFGIVDGPDTQAAPLPAEAFASVTQLRRAVGAAPAEEGAEGAQGAEGAVSGEGVRMRLELNYRSQQAVLDASMALLAPAYSHRPGAQLRLVSADADADADAGTKTPSADVEIMFPGADTAHDAVATPAASRAVEVVAVADEEAEAEYVVETLLRRQAAAAPGADKASVAVLYRTNAQSMPIERELIRQGVKYQVVQARSFFQRKEVRDALAYLQLLVSDDPLALGRVINVPPRKIGKATLLSLEHTANVSGVSMWQALELAVAPPPSPPSRRRGGGGGGGEALEGGDGEAMQAVDGEGGASTSTLSEAAAAVEGGVKPPGPAARRALASFHELVAGFRAEVEQATVAEEAADAAEAAEAAEAANAAGVEAETAGTAEREDARSTATPERLDLPGSGARQRAEGDVEAAVRRRANGEAREHGNARSSDDGWAEEPEGLAGLFRAMVRQSGYEAMVRGEEGGGTARWRNLGELATMASPYGTSTAEVQAFLDQVSLVSDLDALDSHGSGGGAAQAEAAATVRLMTVHAAKGLEFDDVFVVGVEEGLFPHHYSLESDAEVEEERRLLYVAMTRARRQLALVHAVSRGRWGKVAYNEPSRFLDALPPALAARRQVVDARPRFRGRRGRRRP